MLTQDAKDHGVHKPAGVALQVHNPAADSILIYITDKLLNDPRILIADLVRADPRHVDIADVALQTPPTRYPAWGEVGVVELDPDWPPLA